MKLAIITCKKLPNGSDQDQPLFKALIDMGFELSVIPWTQSTEWNQFDACLLRSVWDYHKQAVAFSQWLNETSRVCEIFNSKDIVMWNQNKQYLAELQQFGITIAPTTWLQAKHNEDLHRLLQSSLGKPYFLKPVIGADSSGTLRFVADEVGINKAQSHLNHWLPQVDMMLQPYLSTVETFGETSAIYFSGHLSHAVRKIPVLGDYRVQDTFGATDIEYELNPAEMSLAKACLQFLTDKFGDILYARFDFLHGEDGTIYLNEAELIEPSLFFQHSETAAIKMAEAIKIRLTPDTSE